MKKLIGLIVALLGGTVIAYAFNPDIIHVINEGHVIESGQNVESILSQGESESINLHKLECDTMIYSSMIADYDYNTKTAIDLSYPMYMNNGAALNFLNGNYTLVSDEFRLLDTYSGLYLADGNTYNEDLSQADSDAFYLVALENGLYMNAQTAIFKNSLYETTIPVNSIVKFQETDVRFLSYSNGELIHTSIEEVYGATVTIDDVTFDYVDFLDALGLLSDAIALKEDGKDTQKVTEEIQELLDLDNNVGNIKGQVTANNSDVLDAEAGTDVDKKVEGEPEKVPQDDESSTGNNQLEQPDIEVEEGGSLEGDDEEQEKPEIDEGTEDQEVPEGEQEDGAGSGVPGVGGGESPEPEYQEPEVTIGNLDEWAYAIHGDINITDFSATIRRGVAVTVYSKLVGTGDAVVNEDGVKLYSGEDYKGAAAKMRKTYYSSQEFTLSGLEPDKNLYMQYTYSYSMEVKDEETGKKTYRTKFVVSDFYSISTESIEDGKLPTIEMSFTPQFATYSDRMVIEELCLVNDSDYEMPEKGYEEADFDNFQLNVLPYISKLVFNFENDNPITITASTIKKAMLEGGTIFSSSATTLKSNMEHEYKVTALDKYGNELNLRVNGADDCEGRVFTAKEQPTVKIEEVDNVTDKLIIKVIVEDPDKALEITDGAPTELQLIATNIAGERAALTGKWGDGSVLSSELESNILRLPEPEDGKTYTLELNSLAFARTYTFDIYGNYIPQPDGVTDQTVPNKTNVLFGSEKIYTAAITSGSIYVETENVDIRDTGAEVGFKLEEDTTIEVLPLVDELRIHITNVNTSKVESTVIIKESELNKCFMGDPGYEYNEEVGAIQVALESGDSIELVGDREHFYGKSLWEAIMIQAYTNTNEEDGTTELVYSTPVQIRTTVPTGTLSTSTPHLMTYDAIVIKSGIEYSIPVILSNAQFQTKKLEPIILMDDSFIANDVIEFVNFDITDIDGTITGDELAEVRLYKGDALLQKVSVEVADGPGKVRFDKLIPGVVYQVKVVALDYNNDVGYAAYKPEYVLKNYTIEAGSDIKAEITLNHLEYIYDNRTTEAIFSMTGAECAEEIKKTDDGVYNSRYDQWTKVSSAKTDARYTNYIDITEFAQGYDAIELEYQPNTNHVTNTLMPETLYFEFYGQSYNSLTNGYVQYIDGAILLQAIPDGAKYIRIGLGNLEYLTTWGFKLYGYKWASDQQPIVQVPAGVRDESKVIINGKANIVSNSLTNSDGTDTYGKHPDHRTIEKLEVTPGDVYTYSGRVNESHSNVSIYQYIYYLNADGECVQWKKEWTRGTALVIPENVHYITFSVNYAYGFSLYKVADAQGTHGVKYELSADIEAYDKNQYLLDKNGESTVTVNLERAIVVNADEEDYESVRDSSGRLVEMVPGENGHYGHLDYLEYLEPNSSYRLSVKAIFQGEEIVLCSETFRTDSAYIMIYDDGDFSKIYANPCANFLVMEDLTVDNNYDITFYGTIDFNGHTVTRNNSNWHSQRYMIRSLGRGGVLKNLVYVNSSGCLSPIVENNYGTMENIMVKTVGSVKMQSGGGGLIAFNNIGTIRNFIIELGGDVVMSYDSAGIICGRAYEGIIQDGYIYATKGADLVYDTEVRYTGGLIYEITQSAITQNIYASYDVYAMAPDTRWGWLRGFALSSNDGGRGTNGMYHVGDFYLYEEGEKTDEVLSQSAVLRSTGIDKNVWSIAGNTYNKIYSNDKIKTGTVAMLADTTWQSSVLGDAFDIEGSVGVGYYPRLDMPTCMQQHQEYRTLPIENQMNIPELATDQFTEGTTIYNNAGTITLRMENPQEFEISDVQIESLNTTVTRQGMAADGLYDVVLTVSVSSDENEEAYLSEYKVTGFVYDNNGIKKGVSTSYKTQNIEFYKNVSSVKDWISINSHMNWNYRLTSNIQFSGEETVGSVMINGSLTNFISTVTFTGILDGAGYKISGLQLKNVSTPYIIYRVAGGSANAGVRNLFVEDLVLEGHSALRNDGSGFIGFNVTGSIIDNVHISGITVKSMGRVGGLVGYNSGVVKNSSVTDVNLTMNGNAYNLKMGGLVGETRDSQIINCYAKDVSIVAKDVNNCLGLGGLVGYAWHSRILDSYVQGSILSDTKRIGGVVGYLDHPYASVQNTYSAITINTLAGQVGGIIGESAGRNASNLAVGDIFAGNEYVNRVIGFKRAYQHYLYDGFAYEGQIMNTLTSEEVGDAKELFSATELAKKHTWVDTMNFSSQWDYTALTVDEMPKLYYQDTDILLPGQETGVAIPGRESMKLLVEETKIDKNNHTYTVSATLSDSASDYATLVEKIQNRDIEMNIEGMAMTQDMKVDSVAEIVQEGQWTYTLERVANDPCAVRIQIITSDYTHAYDTYRMTITQGQVELIGVIDYGESLYHKVPDRATWDKYMEARDDSTGEYVHAKAGENFEITGTIDFENKMPSVTNLMLGKLEGTVDDAKFTNLNYVTTTMQGGSWILSSKSITGIDFINISGDFRQVAAYQGIATLIGSVNGNFSDCTIQGINFTGNNKWNGSMGLCYYILGKISGVTVENVKIKSEVGGGSVRDQVGSITAYLYGSYTRIKGTNINIDCPYNQYVGGLIGRAQGDTIDKSNMVYAEDIELDNIMIKARSFVGSLLGYGDQGYQLQGLSARNIHIEAMGHAGGIAGRHYTQHNAGRFNQDLSIMDGSVVSTGNASETDVYYTGGMFGDLYYYGDLVDASVKNMVVTGAHRVGGVVGIGRWYMSDIEVLDCTITQYNGNTSTYKNPVMAGGVAGLWGWDNPQIKNVVVRDTQITGENNVGGIIGWSEVTKRLRLNNVYVAEDVTVTANKDNAGGIIGIGHRFALNHIAMGAEVVARRNNAGGVVGMVGYNADYNYTEQNISGTYVRGSVTAIDNVGGVIGYTEAGIKLTKEKIDGVIVATDLHSPGDVEPFGNFEDDTVYTSSKVTVWDNMLINGQQLESVYQEAEAEVVDGQEPLIPLLEGVTICEAEAFQGDKLYTDNKLLDYEKNLGTDNPYMPFITRDNTTEVISNTKSYNGADVGIKRPEPGDNAKATVVYTSGIGTLNIETMEDDVEITVETINGGELYHYTFQETDKRGDTYNVITIPYDFKSAITVDDITYQASEFCTTVMTSGSRWNYISGDSLYYGGDNSSAAIESETVHSPIHLWQGKVLDNDENVYEFTNEWTKYTPDAPLDTDDNGIYDSAVPLYDYTLHQVYYNFTTSHDGTYYGYRILNEKELNYNVYVNQGMKYNSYILSGTTTNRYLAMVTEDTGEFRSYLTQINTRNFLTKGIKEMTNTYDYTASCFVVKYNDGSISVINFKTGDEITAVKPVGIMAFARYSINGLANSLFGTHVTMDDSYLQCENLLGEYESVAGIATYSNNRVVAEGEQEVATGDREVSKLEEQGEYTKTENTSTEESISNSDKVNITGNGELTDEVDTSDMIADESNEDGEVGKSEVDGTAIGDGTGVVNPETLTVKPIANETDVEESSGEGTDNSAADNSAADNSAANNSTANNSAANNSAADSSGTGIGETGTYTIAYNPYVGKYETYATEDISTSGEILGASQTVALEKAIDEARAEDSVEDGNFVINTITSNVLSQDEKHGFIFLGIIGVMGVLVVITMNVKMRKRRK